MLLQYEKDPDLCKILESLLLSFFSLENYKLMALFFHGLEVALAS
jgi:hypothetical protein